MADNALFRKSALDKLASPERLDVLMQVTSPQGWVALWTMAVVLAIAIGWAIFGSLPERVIGRGLLIRGESNRNILAGGAGTISSLTIDEGDVVQEGQVIAEISGATMNQELTAARGRVEALEAEHSRTLSRVSQQRLTLQGQRGELQQSLARSQADLEAHERRLPERQDSLAKQVIAQAVFDAFMRDLRMYQGQVSSANQRLGDVNLQLGSLGNEVAQSQARLDAEKNNYAIALASIGSATTVTSNFSGKVVSLPKRQGDAVRQGETVAIVEESAASLQAAIFVPEQQGPRVKLDMPVQVDLSPAVQREEYGVLLGTVSYVGQTAATPAEVQAVAGEARAQEFTQSPVFLVRVALTADPDTPSGFRWSSSAGPPQQIASGASVGGDVIVLNRRPICKVLPVTFLGCL